MKKLNLPSGVVVLGLVSFCTDVSSEMIYPLLPVFLSTELGASALALGLIEGIAESTAAILKLISGYWSDHIHQKRPFVVWGYAFSGFARPLIGLAMTWPLVLAIRFADRVGKGIRSSPRDAMISDFVDEKNRGRAYGFHRAMDHAGAVTGPLIATALAMVFTLNTRAIFLWAAVPALIAFLLVYFFVFDNVGGSNSSDVSPDVGAPNQTGDSGFWLDKNFRLFLCSIFVFTLGGSTDAFLLLRLNEVGLAAPYLPLIWSAHHLVKMVSSWYGGVLSDAAGEKKTIGLGWLFYALIYILFAFVSAKNILIIVFLFYGLYYGLSEPAEKSLVSRIAPGGSKGKAFGAYHFVVGLGSLPASLLFGWLWQTFGASVAFVTGGSLALVAGLLLQFVKTAELKTKGP